MGIIYKIDYFNLIMKFYFEKGKDEVSRLRKCHVAFKRKSFVV